MTKRSGASRRKKAKERAAAAAAYPPWVLLERYCVDEVEVSSSSIADLTTLAACHTASGSPIAAALCVAAPPEASRVCIQLPGDTTVSYSEVVAAHGDSVLISVQSRMGDRADHFVYSAGDAAGDPPRPPSLMLLPPFYPDEEKRKFYHRHGLIPTPRQLHTDSTGLLRRGEDDEIVVAELEMEMEEGTDTKAAELVLFRSGDWSIRRPQFSHGTTDDRKLAEWFTRDVVPVGGRTLCWSDRMHGVILSDVLDDDPTLRYVPFPVESRYGFAVCTTGGGATVKAVNVFPHCWCFDNDDDRWISDEDDWECRCSIDTFTIRTWMLRMDDTTWVIDGKVDSNELWALDAYQGLPRYYLRYPVVSLDDPDAVTFELCQEDQGVRLQVMVDMRRKLIPAVFRYPPERKSILSEFLIPSRSSGYLNSSPN